MYDSSKPLKSPLGRRHTARIELISIIQTNYGKFCYGIYLYIILILENVAMTYLDYENYVKFLFLTLPSNPLKTVTVMHNCCLKRKNKKLWNFQVTYSRQTWPRGQGEAPLLCQFGLGMRVDTRTVRIHSTAAEKPASLFHVIFKGMSKKIPWPFQSVYGD